MIYPGTTDKTVSFVGSHFDVVHADPAKWKRDPFKLTVEGDLLHGRGSTDCLGHIALLTDLFVQLATTKPVLKRSVIGVMIAAVIAVHAIAHATVMADATMIMSWNS